MINQQHQIDKIIKASLFIVGDGPSEIVEDPMLKNVNTRINLMSTLYIK